MARAMSPSRRLSLQYVLLFGSTGVSLPFAGLWLGSRGFSGAEIGLLLAAPMLGRLVTGPLIAVWADGFRLRRTALALLGLAAAAGYGAATLASGLAPVAVAWFIGATAMASAIPLLDVLTLKLAAKGVLRFSPPRGFGSAAFVVANVAMGALLTRGDPDLVVGWIVAAGLAFAVSAWRLLPAEPVAEGGPLDRMARFRGMHDLLRDRAFVLAILAVGLTQATHAFYYGFSALIWKAQGLAEGATGLLWAFAVLVEIAFIWWLEPWRRKAGIGARALLLIGAVSAVVRWGLMALSPPLWALWPLQALHALTFAATYLAGVDLVERLSPPQSHSAAQTLNSALSSGVLIGLATIASGPLFDAVGAAGYWAMAALALVGGLVSLLLPAQAPDQARSPTAASSSR